MVNIIKFEKDIKIKFKDKSLIISALTHKSSNQKINNEPLEDSYLDVSNYGIMAVIVKNKKWGK